MLGHSELFSSIPHRKVKELEQMIGILLYYKVVWLGDDNCYPTSKDLEGTRLELFYKREGTMSEFSYAKKLKVL